LILVKAYREIGEKSVEKEVQQKVFEILWQESTEWWANSEDADYIASTLRAYRGIEQGRRLGGLLFIATGGSRWIYYPRARKSVSGYGDVDCPFVRAAILAGITVVDLTDTAVELYRYPMAWPGGIPDPTPWTLWSRAPVGYIATLAKYQGATVYNL
jgi:hypothetical protein